MSKISIELLVHNKSTTLLKILNEIKEKVLFDDLISDCSDTQVFKVHRMPGIILRNFVELSG